MNKYDACKVFDAGCRFALFREGEHDWDNPLWLAGYNFGFNEVRSKMIPARNAALNQAGFESIGIVRLASQPSEPPTTNTNR